MRCRGLQPRMLRSAAERLRPPAREQQQPVQAAERECLGLCDPRKRLRYGTVACKSKRAALSRASVPCESLIWRIQSNIDIDINMCTTTDFQGR